MANSTVYEGDIQRQETATTSLFQGQKLFFAQKVPNRKWLLENARLNGAQIVPLEKQADVILVDHMKGPHQPNSFSFRYVELSIRHGSLEDLEDHRLTSSSAVDRPAGSVITASRKTRNQFTEAEDQLLWDFVKPYVDSGGYRSGNEIFKDMARRYPRHTWQSWRDRWVKRTQNQTRQVTDQVDYSDHEIPESGADAAPSPKRRKLEEPRRNEPHKANIGLLQSKQGQASLQTPHTREMGNVESSTAAEHSAEDIHSEIPLTLATAHEQTSVLKESHDLEEGGEQVEGKAEELSEASPTKVDKGSNAFTANTNPLSLPFGFTRKEAQNLYQITCFILDTHADKLDGAWEGVAKERGHTKAEWQIFFNDFILPEYIKRNGIETDEQLKAHYTAEIVARREQALKNKEAEARAIENSENENVLELNSTGAASGLSHTHQSITGLHPEIHSSSSLQSHENRPPRPNESRKLGQARGSQSHSSQSQSQSQSQSLSHSQSLTTSQPSQQSKSAQAEPDVIATTNSRVAQSQTQTESTSEAGFTRDASEGAQFLLTIDQSSKSSPKTQFVTQLSQRSYEQNDRGHHFVTQRSHSQGVTSQESDESLRDIPHRPETPPPPYTSSESPLFIPEEPGEESDPEDQLEQQPLKYGKDDDLEMRSSPAVVQLVEEEERRSDRESTSEYTPSETPSEGINFESQLQPSQAWETAPQGALAAGDYDDDDVEGETDDEDDEDDKDSTEDDFETAPTAPSRMQSEAQVDPRQPTSRKLDTQALFQQPTQQELGNFITIPEPPGGWDDEDILADDTNPPSAFTNDQVTAETADWTMAIPEPDIDIDMDIDDQDPPSTNLNPTNNVKSWSTLQSNTYPEISSFLLNPLSDRALEATTFNFDLATEVLSRMIKRFNKGKHQSIRDMKKLPKKQRKAALTKFADDLVPDDMPGCWTRDDDKALHSSQGREVQSVVEKHGLRNLDTRTQFLDMWNR